MKIRSFLCCLALLFAASVFAQTGKYFTATGTTCKNAKVFVDQRVIDYSSSAITLEWTGGCKETFADGKGMLTVISKVPNRSFTLVYEGVLKKGKKEGDGVLDFYLINPVFEPAYKYTGHFKNDEFDGYGEFSSRVRYPASLKAKENGAGIIETYRLDHPAWRTDLYFSEYRGNFLNGKIADTENGNGKTRRMGIAEEMSYTGAVKNGVPNGKGKAAEANIVALTNGQSYYSISGNFVNGFLDGYGKEVSRMSQYEGEFARGIHQGKGKLTTYGFNTGLDVIQDKTLEEGKYVYSILDGNFDFGFAEGLATIYYQNSAAHKYTGPVKLGIPMGTGELEYVDGGKYTGNFSLGQMEGKGSMLFPDGTRFSGEFINDKPVSGTYYYTDGEKYEGGMSTREERDKDNKKVQVFIRQGKGTITFKDGTKKEVTCLNNNCN